MIPRGEYTDNCADLNTGPSKRDTKVPKMNEPPTPPAIAVTCRINSLTRIHAWPRGTTLFAWRSRCRSFH